MISVIHRSPRPRCPSISCLAAIRALTLPSTLAVVVLFGLPQVWAIAAPTTMSLTVTSSGSDVTTVAAGTVVTLTATVVSGSTQVHPGSVKFCDATAKYCEDSALLATAQLTTAGIATYKFRPGIGSHSYQAVFVGTGAYTKSTSTTADLTVTAPYPTTTTITSSGSIGNYALTSTVVGTGNYALSPTGNISFLNTTNNNASLGSAALGTSTEGESFTTSSIFASGFSPGAVGDFNGDGILDVVTAQSNPDMPLQAGNFGVFLGNGDGTFTFKSSFVFGFAPATLVVGDFNGDGIPDLATANYGNGTITVLLSNGDGTFTAKSSTTVPSGAWAIAAGDFNGDGISDLAVASSNQNVSVLLGNGDGTFTVKSAPSAGEIPNSVVVADFNGDGIQDLAVTDYLGGTLLVLLGNGDGTFTTTLSTSLTSPGNTLNGAIFLGDFNGDGIPDLVTAGQILLGNGDGTFTVKPFPMGAGAVAVGDFNGDGILDLATTVPIVGGTGANPKGISIEILLGNGNGTFNTVATPSDVVNPFGFTVGDFNGDGLSDLAVVDTSLGYYQIYRPVVKVLLNQVTQTATASLSQVSVPGSETHQIVASYLGDTNYNSSISSAVTLLASKVATTLTLSANPNPSIYTAPVTLTATLKPNSAGDLTTDGETVNFYNNGTLIEFGVAQLTSGVATITLDPDNFNAP